MKRAGSRWHVGMLGVALLPLLLAGGELPDAPVADAARRSDLEAVRALLREGADVNAAQGDGMTALHWAARNGDAEMARVLVYAGASVHAGTRIGHYTPLHLASGAAHLDVVRMLLEARSDPNAATTNSGATPLHLAAGAGDAGVVAALVEHGADVNRREGSWGQTPLIFAAARNRVETIEVLLAAGADPALAARSVDVVERAAADSAAEKRISDLLAEFKKQEGGGPDWQPRPSQVQAAIEASREVQLRWPNLPSDADSADAAPDTSDVGTDEDATEADETTGKEAPPPGEEGPPEGEPAQDEAGTDAEPEEADEEPRPPSYAELVGGWGGLTPLLHAVRQGHRDAVLALLAGGADVDQVSEGDQTSPLLMATLNGQFDLARLLLERGADPDLASSAGATPLYAVLEREWAPRASYSHPTEHQQQRTTYLEMLDELLKAGADPNVRLKTHLWYMEYTFSVLGGSGINLMGATPFWRAAYALDVDAMRLLLAHGADPELPTMKPPQRRRRDDDGAQAEEDLSGVPPVPTGGPAIYPIHAASGVGYGQSFAGNAHRHVPGGWLPAVRFLVEEAGADVNARDANAYTALHHAASRGDDAVILYLVERGADVTVQSRRGQTTADMANGPVQRVQPFPETVALLERLGSKNNQNCVSC